MSNEKQKAAHPWQATRQDPAPPGYLFTIEPDTPPDAGMPSGAERKRRALADLEARRADIIRAARIAMLRHLLRHGVCTADDIRGAVTLPDDVAPVCLGAVPGPLARAGIIVRAGYVTCRRPERHAAPTTLWRLADRAAAERWLAAHDAST